MKFRLPFRKAFSRAEQLAALNERFDSIGKLPDPAERLLEYDKLSWDADTLHGKAADKAFLISFSGFAGGAGMFIGGCAMMNPLLVGAGLVTLCGATVLEVGVAADTRNAARELRERSRSAIAGIVSDPPLQGMVSSPHFAEAMKNYPALKEKFLQAIARGKFIEAPPPPKPPGSSPGFRL
jgi:hypothetical protein